MKKLLVLLLTVFALTSCEQDPEIIGVDAEKKLPKVDISHYDAKTNTWKTLSINENALKAHLKHGDLEGAWEGRQTYVPDDGFEQFLILKGYDEAPLDDYVLTSNIINVKNLRIKGDDPEIRSLIGLEDFRALEDLLLYDEIYLKDLDLSKNIDLINLNISSGVGVGNLNISKNVKLTRLKMQEAGVANLDLTGNIALETLILEAVDDIENLDLTNNIALTRILLHNQVLINLDLTKNIALEYIGMEYGSVGSSLDLSQNKNLNTAYIYLNNLLSINVKNGNNTQMTFGSSGNNLKCIQVDDEISANSGLVPYDTWVKPAAATYSEDCGF